MKLLLIANMYPTTEYPTYGVFVKNFKENLEKLTVKYQTVFIYGKSKNVYDKIIKYLKYVISVVIAVRKNNYELIYVHYINHSLLPFLFIKNICKKPLIINAHGSDVITSTKIGNIIQKLVYPIIKKANLVVVPSSYYKQVIIEKYKISEEYVFISPSAGINIQVFKQLNIKKSYNCFTIGYISRIDHGKGWNVLLESIYILKSKNKIFKVMIIGGGSQEKVLDRKIKSLKLQEYIEYLGPIKQEKLPLYINQMDVFVFPTIRKAESLGLVGLEAMACGVPIIGSNIGGLKDYIKDGINGKLFEPGNANELSEKISYFMDMNENDINKYKNTAIETAKLYESETISISMKNKIQEIINLQKSKVEQK